MDFLIIDNYAKLKSNFAAYKHVKVFISESMPAWAADKVLTCLQGARCKVSRLVLPSWLSLATKADALEDSDEDFVLAVGDSNTCSVAKYYAYCHIKPFATIPFGSICPHDFSKYAFLKDIKMCFYVCEPPEFVFVDSDFFEPTQVQAMHAALSYINIVTFENEFNKLIYNANSLDLDGLPQQINNTESKLCHIGKIYASFGLLLSGNKTSDLLGCNYLAAGLMQLKGTPLSQGLNDASNLLVKFYDCLLRFPILNNTPNLNLHLRALKQNFGISYLHAGHILSALPSADNLREVTGKFHAYQPYLSARFAEVKHQFIASGEPCSANTFSAIALAASISNKPSPLKFARDCGYFEDILSKGV